jgi:organic hydroperoxide reductase OsmC/OhrA
MSEHRASISWTRTSADYTYQTYNRDHDWTLGQTKVQASAAPEYRGNAALVNPEGALVAAISSCHMLTFLAVAAKRKLSLDSYEDDAVGYLEKNAQGRLSMTRAILRPKIVWTPGVTVSAADLEKLHHDAHEGCFIANSVTTAVTVEPRS